MLSRYLRNRAVPASASEMRVRLPVRLGSEHVERFFEEPLARALGEAGLGTVSTRGMALNDAGELVSLDLAVSLVSDAERAVERIVSELERLDAPVGSSVASARGGSARAFGRAEGLGLYLRRDRLPSDDAEAHLDVLEDCIDALGDLAIYQGSKSLGERVALYFYGPSFNRMSNALAFVLANNPCCDGAETLRLT